MMKGPLFYAKILLFGEYGIIKNAKALSIPYNYYKGDLPNREVRSSRVRAFRSAPRFAFAAS